MVSDKTKRSVSPWLPAWFCAVLIGLGVFGEIFMAAVAGPTHPGTWVSHILLFLPMCFYFAGANTTQLQREIDDLRLQLAQLKGSEHA